MVTCLFDNPKTNLSKKTLKKTKTQRLHYCQLTLNRKKSEIWGQRSVVGSSDEYFQHMQGTPRNLEGVNFFVRSKTKSTISCRRCLRPRAEMLVAFSVPEISCSVRKSCWSVPVRTSSTAVGLRLTKIVSGECFPAPVSKKKDVERVASSADGRVPGHLADSHNMKLICDLS